MGDGTRDRNQVEAARALLDLVFDTSTPCVTPSSQPAIAQPQPLTAGVSWPWRQLPRARTCRQPKLDSPQGAHLAHRKCHVLAGSSGWGTLSTAPSPSQGGWAESSDPRSRGRHGSPCPQAPRQAHQGGPVLLPPRSLSPEWDPSLPFLAWEGSLVAPLLTWGWGPLHPPGPPGRAG